MFEKDLIRIFLKFENCGNYMQKYNLQKSPRGSKADLSGQTLKFIFLWKRKEKGNCYKRTFKYLTHNTMLKRLAKIRGRKI